jgi:predicted acylesterase/phospholipase RssA
MLPGKYDRTVRLGELFEQELFAKALSDEEKVAAKASGIWLTDLKIDPADEEAHFNAKTDNWRRRAKIPILVLNATTLNTGHSWQYTATWMGESPHAIAHDVDGNNRLRRMWYEQDAPEGWKKVRLGQAVAASACVPGLFEPVRVADAYGRFDGEHEDTRWIVRQVDGGVHDNQGIASLLEQGCSVLLVSDASGQTVTQENPPGGIIEPLLRSNAILMQRVREEQFRHLDGLTEGGLLKGVMTVHLKLGLDVRPVGWVGCEDPPEVDADFRKTVTSYGIRKDVQERLAGIRTDLDCFSEVEAFALMTSGYRMVEQRITRAPILDVSEKDAADAQVFWEFRNIESIMNVIPLGDPKHQELKRLLSIGGERLFKTFRLVPWLRYGVYGIGAVMIGLIGCFFFLVGDASLQLPSPTVKLIAASLIVLAAALRVPFVRQQALRIGLGSSLVSGGWLTAALNVYLVTPIYLWLGSIKRLENLK